MKWMISEAFILSAYYSCLIHVRPFAEISPLIGTLGHETMEMEIENNVVSEVAGAVSMVCRRTPWESKCLVRALTAKKMLNRRSLPCTLYMGVALEDNGEMAAHAWLRCGNVFVSGGDGSRQFTITTIYGDVFTKE